MRDVGLPVCPGMEQLLRSQRGDMGHMLDTDTENPRLVIVFALGLAVIATIVVDAYVRVVIPHVTIGLLSF